MSDNHLRKGKHYFNLFLLFILFSIPLILIALPVDFFDYGNTICIYTLITNKNCYGCGMTRAIMHLIHFDFENTFAYNMISFIILPLLFLLWLKEILIKIKRYLLQKKHQSS